MSKSFLEKLRDPDVDFLWHLRMLGWTVPLGMAFLIMIVLLIIMAITKVAGTEIIVSQTISRWSKSLPFLFVLFPFVILKVMQGYVSIKLKKKELP